MEARTCRGIYANVQQGPQAFPRLLEKDEADRRKGATLEEPTFGPIVAFCSRSLQYFGATHGHIQFVYRRIGRGPHEEKVFLRFR